MSKPELLNYLIPQTGQVIKVLSDGKALNLPCATKMPGPIASSIFTAHILMLIEMWGCPSKYGIVAMKAPAHLMEQVVQYHLEEFKVQVDCQTEEDYLKEPNSDTPLNYDQVLNWYMRPVIAEQKGEVERLRSIL